MDLSKQTNTSVSMYFDAESSASSSAFNTMEGISDISTASTVDANETLEADGARDATGAILINTNLTMKSKQISKNLPSSPLHSLSKTLLREYRAHCSTPTREQIVRSNVLIARDSVMVNCIDLRTAFRGADDDDKMINSAATQSEENKENALPEKSCEVSTLSQSSSVGIVTIIDRNKISTNESAAECEEDEKNNNDNMMDIDVVKVKNDEITIDEPKVEKMTTDATEDEDKKEAQEIAKEAPKVNIKRVPLKGRRSFLPTKGARKSVCEPDLKNNRPSRISLLPQNTQRNNNQKTMLEALHLKRKTNNDIETEIPKLLTKALNLNQQLVDVSSSNSSSGTATSTMIATRQSVTVTTEINHGERKIIPPKILVPEKRPYQYAQRMSTMVKTTLNSPARKIMRRSMMPPISYTSDIASRRSIMPPTKPVINQVINRRSMLPQSSRSKVAVATAKTGLVKASATNMPKNITPPANKKKTITKIPEYKCTVCNAKFSIKSLLDAHKRSHEDGVPAFVRKPAAVNNNSNSSNNVSNSNNNKCKYCDKKFALLRTLHIHLMEKCTKIPPAEKRKLVFTEMQHVEKAQLPIFSQSAGNSSNASSVSSLTVSRGESTLSTSDTMPKNKEVAVMTRELAEAMGELELSPIENNDKKQLMGPPSISKVKRSAHAGVYRTPNKSVPCHICNISFKSVLEYTKHSMQTHGNINDDDDYDGPENIHTETAV